MTNQSPISFNNTEYAFAYKADADLKKANFLFSSMGKPWLINWGLKFTPLAIKWHVPFTKTIIRSTIFNQFVGGETLEQTATVAKNLHAYNVQVILDYGVEGGDDGEVGFDNATQEFIKVINYAATQPNIPFISIKVTGFSRFTLLEKIDTLMNQFNGTLMKRYLKAVDNLTESEKEEWHTNATHLRSRC
jgi:proline dehydrogenase